VVGPRLAFGYFEIFINDVGDSNNIPDKILYGFGAGSVNVYRIYSCKILQRYGGGEEKFNIIIIILRTTATPV